ncbi:MAG: hypothetical protein ACRDIV_13940 [Ktedonobacteraceae bacterium]
MSQDTNTQPTTSKRSSPLSYSSSPQDEELMKFTIGLRLLDEKKRARVLAFLQTLLMRKEDTPHGL